jgi:hypothetical protein
MDNNFFELYVEQNKDLIKTMIIKSEVSADSINNSLIDTYGNSIVDALRPETWKYYLNLSGVYHATDEIMKVTSLDTLEIIDFTKDNLEFHPQTKDAYRFGSRYYISLLRKYPNYEQLILGILDPIDIMAAVGAPDHTILQYNKDLVEYNEYSVIPRLQEFIYNHQARWDIKSFSISNPYYPICQHAILTLNMLTKLLNIRFSNCKTTEAHSFHVREYLRSHNGLDKHIPYLTNYQIQYLYRNILYLERHVGSTAQFNELLDKLLSARGIPLADFTVRILSKFDDKLYPEVGVRRKQLNLYESLPHKEYLNITDLFSYELEANAGNAAYLDQHSNRIIKEFATSDSSVFQTKVLQSYMTDYADFDSDTAESVFIRTWVSVAFNHWYSGMINFTDPINGDYYLLSIQDTFILYLYLVKRLANLTSDEIPVYLNMRERKLFRPTKTELLGKLPAAKRSTMGEVADEILLNVANIDPIISPKSLRSTSDTIFKELRRQWLLVNNRGDLFTRPFVRAMSDGLLTTKAYKVSTFNTFTEWRNSLSLGNFDYSANELTSLMTAILGSVGFKVDSSVSAANVQRSMLEIMKSLTSYGVQYLSSVDARAIRPVGMPIALLSEVSTTNQNTEYVNQSFYIESKSNMSFDIEKVLLPTTTRYTSNDFNIQTINFIGRSMFIGELSQTDSQETIFASSSYLEEI